MRRADSVAAGAVSSEESVEPAGARSLLRFLHRSGAVIALGATGAGMLAQYVLHAVLGQQFGPSGYGLAALSLNILSISGLLVQAGFQRGIVRLAAEYDAAEDRRRLVGVLRVARRITTMIGLALAIPSTLLLLAFRFDPRAVAALSALAVTPAVALLLLSQGAALGLRKIGWATIPQNVVHPCMAIIACVIIATTQHGTTVFVVAYGALALLTAVVVQGRIALLPNIRAGTDEGPIYETRSWLRVAFPMLASNVWYQVMMRADVILMSLFAPAPVIGGYALANRLAQATVVPNLAFNQTSAPLMAAAHARSDLKSLQRTTKKTAVAAFITTLLLAIVLTVFAKPVIRMFGIPQQLVLTPFLILLIGYAVAGYHTPALTVLQMGDCERLVARVYTVTAGLTLAGYFISIPLYGPTGAAIVSSVGLVARNFAFAHFARTRLNCRTGALARVGAVPTSPS